MYCPICGVESQQGFNYCKRCGASLAQSAKSGEPVSVPVKLTGMFLLTMTVVTVLGFSIAIIAPSELAHKYNEALVGIIIVLTLAITAGIDLLLVWLLLHLLKLSHRGTDVAQSNAVPPVTHAPAQIPAPMTGVSSVTEHTTRNFESLIESEPGVEPGSVRQRATK
ncbi:MAG TPA: hypothetical protein VLD57_12455 [Blastocatellia bacterium]|nr:hypothetical protein [Blastocatellia bacterium]